MPGPAARLGDPTAHGGAIVFGFPQVLIGGMPAARLMDPHLCPMMTPAVAPIPHVGGPISGPGVPTVLIGGLPAATVGDMLVCFGPPDVVAMGCPTVMIGMAGSGSGSSGSAGAGGAGGAVASANVAQFDNNESTTVIEHWIEFKFEDAAGLPVSGVEYEFADASGRTSHGVLRTDGRVRRDAMQSAGSCSVVLMSVYDAKWSGEAGQAGESVDMEAKVEGFEDGRRGVFQVFRRDVSGPDVMVHEAVTNVSGGSVRASWTPEVSGDAEVLVPPEGAEGPENMPAGYSNPDFYFEVIVGRCKTRSGLLHADDFIEIEVIDDDGEPLANERYVLYLADGEVREGRLDGSGRLREEGVPPGLNQLRLPNLPDFKADV